MSRTHVRALGGAGSFCGGTVLDLLFFGLFHFLVLRSGMVYQVQSLRYHYLRTHGGQDRFCCSNCGRSVAVPFEEGRARGRPLFGGLDVAGLRRVEHGGCGGERESERARERETKAGTRTEAEA
eukprot:2176077-Rhodomonas_salina.2